MANSYYDKSAILAALAVVLGERGWNVVGYHADESDSRVDYWQPARWDGYATKGPWLVSSTDYLSRKPIIARSSVEGTCSRCNGTGKTLATDFEIGMKYVTLIGGAESFGPKEGEPCRLCKGKGVALRLHEETTGHHPAYPGPGKGSSWAVSKLGEAGIYYLVREGRLFDGSKVNRHNDREKYQAALTTLAEQIEQAASDRPSAALAAGPCTTLAEAAGSGAVIRHNTAMNGLEVAFPAKPEAAMIVAIKAAGFRWSSRSKVWYTRFSAAAEDRAYTLLGLPRPEGVRVALDALADESLGLHR